MFRFLNAEYLHFLWLLPLVVILYWYFIRRKRKKLSEYADEKMHDVLLPEKSFYKEVYKFGLVLTAIILLVLAVARPQIGTRLEEVKQIGIDVFIILDVSMSMNAEDLKPTRLEKAKNEISSLIRKLEGDRIGLIIFAGQSYVQFPLTTDYSAASLFLSAVDVYSIPQPGTAIASAINLATQSFEENTATKKVVVIITDGEDHEGDISSAVKNAVDNGIMIYAIGMGSPAGSPIPVYDGRGNQSGFKQDNSGNIVLTKLDEATLRQISSEGNGKYYLSSSSGDELDLIYDDLASIEKKEYGSKRITDYDDKYFYFLIPALLLLFIEVFMSEKKSLLLQSLFKRRK
ncbi:MAG: VWA domain-containing protein [Ignavibacteriales bacterium]|nr:VWA domain-containing protein [Ignavibacteriales bacterium]HOJ19056.1 VWA domain-containing protein [Ignavibacteriaceae bacterium]HPO54509.1 VWA domain-containing protein [Ignavibacteriaceae bacterium]